MSRIASFLPGTAARFNSFVNAERWFFSPTYWPMHIAIGAATAFAVHFFRAFTENYIDNKPPQRRELWNLFYQTRLFATPVETVEHHNKITNAIYKLDSTDQIKEVVNISMLISTLAASVLLFVSALFYKGPQRKTLFLGSCSFGAISTYFIPLHKKDKYKTFFISSAVLAASVGWMEVRK